MKLALRCAFALALVASGVALSGCKKSPPPPHETPREWQLLASELPSALLSVSGRSPTDVYAVGADKGHGPLVLHFDGKKWGELHTGTRGDLWWVQALPHGPALMAGAGARVLRFDGNRFECVVTPGNARQTVYGVWGKDADDFYAVGSASGKNGFVWHHRGGGFVSEALPPDMPRVAGGEVPGFFKVFGMGDDVWVVGTGGTILHRRGAAPFTVVPTTTKDTLFTVHGTGERVVAVGGSGNGVVLQGSSAGFHDASPPAAGLIQGVFTTEGGDWASGERSAVYSRAPGAATFTAVDHGFTLPLASSFHSIWVDSSGGVWSAGGNVLSVALDSGMLVHYGQSVPPVVIEEDATAVPAGGDTLCPVTVVDAGKK